MSDNGNESVGEEQGQAGGGLFQSAQQGVVGSALLPRDYDPSQSAEGLEPRDGVMTMPTQFSAVDTAGVSQPQLNAVVPAGMSQPQFSAVDTAGVSQPQLNLAEPSSSVMSPRLVEKVEPAVQPREYTAGQQDAAVQPRDYVAGQQDAAVQPREYAAEQQQEGSAAQPSTGDGAFQAAQAGALDSVSVPAQSSVSGDSGASGTSREVVAGSGGPSVSVDTESMAAGIPILSALADRFSALSDSVGGIIDGYRLCPEDDPYGDAFAQQAKPLSSQVQQAMSGASTGFGNSADAAGQMVRTYVDTDQSTTDTAALFRNSSSGD